MILKALNPYMIGGVGTALVAAWILGNLHATKRELDNAYDRSAREMAAATGALIEQRRADKVADVKAHQTYAANLRVARRDRDSARTAYEKEKATNANLQKQMADGDAACGFSGELRRALDTASGALDPEDGSASVVAGTGAARPTAADRLTCDQLVRGYITLGNSYRDLASKYDTLTERVK